MFEGMSLYFFKESESNSTFQFGVPSHSNMVFFNEMYLLMLLLLLFL